MLIDDEKLIVEHYQKDVNDCLFPDELTIYKKGNSPNDIVENYIEYTNEILSKNSVKINKSEYFDILNKITFEYEKEINKETTKVGALNDDLSTMRLLLRKDKSATLRYIIRMSEDNIESSEQNIDLLSKKKDHNKEAIAFLKTKVAITKP